MQGYMNRDHNVITNISMNINSITKQ